MSSLERSTGVPAIVTVPPLAIWLIPTDWSFQAPLLGARNLLFAKAKRKADSSLRSE
jgi:hypothetical protein